MTHLIDSYRSDKILQQFGIFSISASREIPLEVLVNNCETFLTLCLPSASFGTSACLPDLTFGTNTVAMHIEINPMVLYLWTLSHNGIVCGLL